MKNLMAKMRPIDGSAPYLTVFDQNAPYGPTTFYVLKAHRADPEKPYSSVFVKAVSPATGPSGEVGDAYWGDVNGVVTQRDPIVTDEMLPAHLRGERKTATTLAGVVEQIRQTYPGATGAILHHGQTVAEQSGQS